MQEYIDVSSELRQLVAEDENFLFMVINWVYGYDPETEAIITNFERYKKSKSSEKHYQEYVDRFL